MKTLKTNSGFSLMELLAYIAIVGLVIILLTATFTFVIKTYTDINIKGRVYTEANYIMSSILSATNSFDADYVRTCEDNSYNCIELVKEDELIIDAESGVIKDKKVNETLIIQLKQHEGSDGYDLFINNTKINSDAFLLKVDPNQTDPHDLDPESREDDAYTYIHINSCFDKNQTINNDNGICQDAVIEIKLSIFRVNQTHNEVPYRFINRITF
ncbi:pilus assembly FimT family protein [Haloplasma contractile]|uniref:Prepilin-type N-terminal cleavage/methylation domain-containing protein n=1 Tax=Haloplasma contractile SSD-17B TaxID=1033810 RepID=U2EGR5_9MOLU|nr:hypothetical protein [Haloplasma contractile]ERJ13806.1 hypothetical protein HLPCO_000472 [Haloplasma contractile SSD-17B]